MNEKCRVKDEELTEFFYGESSDPGLEAHIAGCHECSRRLEGMKKVTEIINSSKRELPQEAWDIHTAAVMKRIKEDRRIKMPSFIRGLFENRLVLTGAAAFAAVLLVAGMGWMYSAKTSAYDRDRAITERMELFENMEVLERLDFYSNIAGELE